MNPYSGHLVNQRALEAMSMLEQSHYTPVPPSLQHAAASKLQGRNEANVSLTSGGKLAKWAASERKQRRIDRQARKRNR